MPALPTDPLLERQWNLHGTGLPNPAVNINITPAWRDYTGRGIRIGIYDSLVEKTHADLAAGYDPTLEAEGLEYSFTGSAHGTQVAGIIAARANNLGITGIAHGASITSLPVIFSGPVVLAWVELAMAQARHFDVISMSYGGTIAFDPYIDPAAWGPIAPHYTAAAETGRQGLGTIMVTAAGNNRTTSTDANLSYYQTQRQTFLVAATNTEGQVAEYSSTGANILVCAPSSDGFGTPGITTTDRSGIEGANYGTTGEPVPLDYATRFGGTSAAAPMVAGIAALMLEANPALGWRDVRDILALSARHTGTAIGQPASEREKTPWFINAAARLNGAGFHISQNYGFGLVDAHAAIRLAETWDTQQTSANEQSRTAAFTGDLVLNTTDFLHLIPLAVDQGVIAEHITLALNISGMLAQDLEIILTSPAGTASTLFFHSGGPTQNGTPPLAFRPWTFVSNAFLGEDAAGTWQLSIRDTFANNSTGHLTAATLTVYGDAASPDDRYTYTREFGQLAGITHTQTIADPTGHDTIDAATLTTNSTIDLRPGATSQLNTHPLAITPQTQIENAIGGDGHDRLTGNSAANHLRGGRGNDTLFGEANNDTLDGGDGRDSIDGGTGQDTILGGPGIDILRGRAGNDDIDGGPGDDWIEGGDGADTMRGGPGMDALSYAASPAPVTVALGQLAPGGAQFVNGGHATGDLVHSFEHITGSRFADTLTGNAGRNHIAGGPGGDTISGAAGNDIFIFGPEDLLGPTPDRILDFHPAAAAETAPGAERDAISLRAIDAIPGAADDPFSYIAAAAFTAIGQLRATFDGTDTILEANTLPGVAPELRIVLANADFTTLLTPADFSL